jgi:hypothetical protein
MDLPSQSQTMESVRRLERRVRHLTWGTVGLVIALLAAVVVGFVALRAMPAPALDDSGILRVRGLAVVDENGTERVWVGAPLPEPLTLGKRFPRGGDVSGVMLYDDEGNERGGYVTSDGFPNVFFTLDGLGKQHVLFLAEPQGDTALWLWNGENAFRLSVGEEGAGLKISSNGETIFEVPRAKPETKGGER